MSNISKYIGTLGPAISDLPNMAYNSDVVDLATSLNLLHSKVVMSDDVSDDTLNQDITIDEVMEEVSDRVDEVLDDVGGSEIMASLNSLSSQIGTGIVLTINLLKNEINPKVSSMMEEIDTRVAEDMNEEDVLTTVHDDVVTASSLPFQVIDWSSIHKAAGGASQIISHWKQLNPDASGSASLSDYLNNVQFLDVSFSNIHLHDDTKALLIKQLNNSGLTREQASDMISLMIDATSLRDMLYLNCMYLPSDTYGNAIANGLTNLEWYNDVYLKYRKVELDLDDATSEKFYAQNKKVETAIAAIHYLFLSLENHYQHNNTIAISPQHINGNMISKLESDGLSMSDVRRNIHLYYTMNGVHVLPSTGIDVSRIKHSKAYVDSQMTKLLADSKSAQDKVLLHYRLKALREVASKYLEDLHDALPLEQQTSTTEFKAVHGAELQVGLNQLGINPNVSCQSVLYNLVFANEYTDTKVATAHRYFNEETISTIADKVDDDDGTEIILTDDEVAMITTTVASKLAVDFLHQSNILVRSS